jgi:hypothetical protein
VAGVVAVMLVALALWPDGSATGGSTGETLSPRQVQAWPARGPLAADDRAIRELTAAWRSAARDDGVSDPGARVEPLYVGDVDGARVALLRSTASSGVPVVAAAVEEPTGWRVLEAVPLDRDVPWLTLPGGDRPRALVAPDVGEASSLRLRRSDGVWTRVAIREDGVTFGLRSLDGPLPVLGVVEGRGVTRRLGSLASLSAMSVLPLPAPVHVDDPDWGRGPGLDADEFDAALYASRVLPETSRRVAVLAATRVPGGRVVLAETVSPTDGRLRYTTVVPGDDGEPTLGPPPQVGGNLAAAVVPRAGGRLLVLAAAAPTLARIEVRGSDGTVYIDGIAPTAVVLAPPVPDTLVVRGKRTNGGVVTSLTVSTRG